MKEIRHEACHLRDCRGAAHVRCLGHLRGGRGFRGECRPRRPSAALVGPGATTDVARHGRDFERFLERYKDANSAFLNGDPGPWLSIATENEPASIFGGFGGLGESGVAEVDQRYLLAAGAFRPSGAEVEIEYLVKDVQGRLAYTVAIERADVLFAGHTAVQPQVLRVTMLFRFERGGWRIIHRHADTMVDLQLPTP
jgi:hypothetical protein